MGKLKIAKSDTEIHEEPRTEIHEEPRTLIDMTGVTAKIVSRGDGPEYLVPAAQVHPDKWATLFSRAVADVLTSLAVVGIEKPKKEDFLNDEEFSEAVNAWKQEKLTRKQKYLQEIFSPGKDFSSSVTWTRISSVRTVMNAIAEEDLKKYFGGHQIRESVPKGIFAYPEGKDLQLAIAKWIAKYGKEIQAEAEDKIKNGYGPVSGPAATVETFDF